MLDREILSTYMCCVPGQPLWSWSTKKPSWAVCSVLPSFENVWALETVFKEAYIGWLGLVYILSVSLSLLVCLLLSSPKKNDAISFSEIIKCPSKEKKQEKNLKVGWRVSFLLNLFCCYLLFFFVLFFWELPGLDPFDSASQLLNHRSMLTYPALVQPLKEIKQNVSSVKKKA